MSEKLTEVPPKETIRLLVLVTIIIWVGSFLYFESAYPTSLTKTPAAVAFKESSAQREARLTADLEGLRAIGAPKSALCLAHERLAEHYFAIEAEAQAESQVEACRDLIDLATPSLGACDFFNWLGDMYLVRSQYDKACQAYFQAAKICPPVRSEVEMLAKAKTLNNMANLYVLWGQILSDKATRQSDFGTADTYFKQALGETKAFPDWLRKPEGKAFVKMVCANYKVCLEDLGRAKEFDNVAAANHLQE